MSNKFKPDQQSVASFSLMGPESGGQRPVLDGLKAGERIVAAGAFHLNNERKRKELE